MLKAKDYLIENKMPFFWCPGCGNGSVIHALVRCFEKLGYTKENTVVVTGIGCWGKGDDYISTNTFHGTHGRAIAFATGIKLANPELNVIALMGDGDGATIGGNHLIHAARRNVDITAIISNNLNYGMTGGQYSGTTPLDYNTSTSVYGHVEQGFDLCELVTASGASYVARSTTYGIMQLEKYILEALQKKGFSLVDAITQCPTHFGRRNSMKTAPEMVQWFKENSLTKSQADKMTSEEKYGKFVNGVFADKDSVDYSTRYAEIIKKASQNK